jgi:hypothetical protein
MDTLDWMTLAIIIGNMLIGKRRILNRDRDTKAFSASRTLFSSIKTKVMKVTKDTTNGAHDHTNEVPRNKKYISVNVLLWSSVFFITSGKVWL